MTPERVPLVEIDPFDLPEWLLGGEVTWSADRGLLDSHLVPGTLAHGHDSLACDLFAVDEAYPALVADEDTRARVHQAWRHGQVLLLEREGRLSVAVPGTRFTADGVLESLGRLAKALGAAPEGVSALLRLGSRRSR